MEIPENTSMLILLTKNQRIVIMDHACNRKQIYEQLTAGAVAAMSPARYLAPIKALSNVTVMTPTTSSKRMTI